MHDELKKAKKAFDVEEQQKVDEEEEVDPDQEE